MFCIKCGTSMADGARFCHQCGEHVQNKHQPEIKKKFSERLKTEVQDKIKADLEFKKHISEMDQKGIPYCPKCYSSNLSANKKGFGVGKAVVGSALIGPLGLVAGNIGAKKIRVTCLKCGHQFWAGQK